MSHHMSEEARQIHRDVKHCSPEELLAIHGIIVEAAGVVFCTTAQKSYNSLSAWIEANTEDDYTGFEKFTQYNMDDDDY